MNDEAGALIKRCAVLAADFNLEREEWRALLRRCITTMEATEGLEQSIEKLRPTIESLTQTPPQWPPDGVGRSVHYQMQGVRQRLADALDKLRQGMQQPLDTLNASFDGFSANAGAWIESVAALSSDVAGAVEESQVGIMAISEDVRERTVTCAIHAEDQLKQAFETGLADAFDQFDQLANNISNRGTEISQNIATRVDAAVGATNEYLTGISEKLVETLGALSEEHHNFGERLGSIGTDLEEMHIVVTTAMKGSGIGMEIATGALNDVRAIMGGVS